MAEPIYTGFTSTGKYTKTRVKVIYGATTATAHLLYTRTNNYNGGEHGYVNFSFGGKESGEVYWSNKGQVEDKELVSVSFNISESGGYYSGETKGANVGLARFSGGLNIPDHRPSYWNDINAYYPDGTTQNGFLFNLRTSDGGVWNDISNEPNPFTKLKGTKATISNIRSKPGYTHLTSVSGATDIGGGQYQWTFDTANHIVHLYSAYNDYKLTLSGCLDGVMYDNLGYCGAISVKIKDNPANPTVINSVGDLNLTYPYNIEYEVFSVETFRGYKFDGYASNSSPRTGKIGTGAHLILNYSSTRYTIKYDANGGSGAPGEQVVKYGDSFTLSNTVPTRPGYTFKKWRDASGERWEPGWHTDSWSYINGDYGIRYNILDLKAGWSPNTYTVSFNGGNDGETNVPTPISYTYSSTGSFELPHLPDHPGKIFTEWYNDDVGFVGRPGDPYPKNRIGNITLYARWEYTEPVLVDLSAKNITPFSLTLNWAFENKSGNVRSYGSLDVKQDGKIIHSVPEKVQPEFGTLDVKNLKPETEYTFVITSINGPKTSELQLKVITPADQAKVHIKKDGQWEKGKLYYKKDGTWVKAKKVYIKKDGVWTVGKNND